MATVGDRVHRRRLVSALRANGAARSAPVIAALSSVPRSRFVPEGTSALDAYADHALVLTTDAWGRPTSTISQPSMVALMLEQLDARPGQRVLEVGTASGYTAALLDGMVRPAGRVVTVEFDAELAATAAHRLAAYWPEVAVRTGDGWCGAPDAAPFDRVHVTVGVDDLSPHWFDQLAEGGVLVAPVTLRPAVELCVAFERRGEQLVSRSVRPCGFVRLRGPHAGPPHSFPLDGEHTVLADWLDGKPDGEPDGEPDGSHEGNRGGATEWLRSVLTGEAVDCGTPQRLPEGWATRLALRHRHALALLTTTPAPELRPGLYDPAGGGVALVVGGRVLAYGDTGAARRLCDELSDPTPLPQGSLRLTARPASHPVPDARWVVRKPHFSYAVDTGEQPGADADPG